MRPPDISGMDFEQLINREWLAVNHCGGYASSTICGLNTRKYHGLLVAAMSPPARRMVLLSHVDETVITDAGSFALSTNEYPGTIFPQGYWMLRAFNAHPFPRWAFQADGVTIEKSLHMLPGQNTVCLSYSLLGADKSVELEIRPLLALRGIHELTYQWNCRLVGETRAAGQVRIPATSRTPEVFFAHDGRFSGEPFWYLNAIHRREEARGYAGLEDLWNPGTFRWTLRPGKTIHLVCSTDPVDSQNACEQLEQLRHELDRQAIESDTRNVDPHLRVLLEAAAAFVVASPGDLSGNSNIGVIGQYPWSAVSGRAALIAFGGLFLTSGRFDQAGALLFSLASQLQNGLIPTEFSETGGPPSYTGADTSLWFVNAVDEYLQCADDATMARQLLPTIETIIEAYSHGTDLGIACDADGLLASHVPGLPTSWMDAKVGDWVVTLRQGRTVELNALWYNALCIAAKWAAQYGDPLRAADYTALAGKVADAFNRRFWNPELNCCFDVVEDHGSDRSIRPNQILAASLPHAVLAAGHRLPMLQTVMNELLTPMGVRTLSPRDPAYHGRYAGNVVSRDRAQHQGSVYAWLLAPLASAHLRVHGRNDRTIGEIQKWLQPSLVYLQGDGLGQLRELSDGDAPHHPGGAIASALSVGQILKCYAQDILAISPAPGAKANPATFKPLQFPLASGLPK